MNVVFQICYAIACTMLLPTLVCDTSIFFSNSMFSMIVAVLLFWLLNYTDRQDYGKRMNVLTHFLGILFSIMTAFGYHMEIQGAVPYTSVHLMAAVLLYSHIFARGLCVLWSFLIRWETVLSEQGQCAPASMGVGRILDRLLDHPVWIMILLMLCWSPCYLSIFPGNFFHDASDEFAQMTEGYRGDFPMLHSVVSNYILKLGYLLTGSYNTGIAAYTILQMLMLALLFTYIIRQFSEKGINHFMLGMMLLYMALFPVIHVLVTSTVRDVMFSGLLVYLVFQTYLMSCDPVSFWGSVRKPIVLGITTTLTILARSNGGGKLLVGALFVASVCFWIGYGKKNRRGTTIFGVSLIGGYLLLHMLLASICQPYRPAPVSGSLSILTQPIARAYFFENESWTQEQRDRFGEYFAVENMKYVPENADGTKGNCYVDENTFGPFLRFWLSMGLRYPACYMDAVLANTMQMWFPGSPVDGYVESGDWPAYEKSFYFFLSAIEEPGIHRNLLPGVQRFYETLGSRISYEKIPVLSMLFSIGAHFWLLLNCIFYAVYRRSRHLYLPLGILLCYTLISAMVPLVCLRYFAALFLAFPVVVVFTLQPTNKNRGRT